METSVSKISKSSSIMYRMSQMFFDMKLEPFQIGCGQQFFLLHIYEQPGITLLELAQKGHYDKGTTTRAVKKLEEQGYITKVTDTDDRRSSKLYATDAAAPVVTAVKGTVEQWNSVLVQGMTTEETVIIEKVMEKMAENACVYMNKRKREV